MKEVTRYQCEFCKKDFKTPDRHQCKKDPALKNCFTCKHLKGWLESDNGYKEKFKGKSFPFSCMRENQLEELSKADSFEGVIPGIVFNFRDLELTYFVQIRHVYYFYHHADRKSFPLEFIQEYGQQIEGQKKRTRYRYDIEKWIEEVEGLE